MRTHKGIVKVSKRLKSGEIAVYYYAWRGGPKLPGKPGEPEFEAAYRAAIKNERSQSHGETFRVVIRFFEAAPEYTNLAPRTKSDYDKFIKAIDAKFGTMPLSAFRNAKEAKTAKRAFIQWRNEWHSRSSRQSVYAFTVLNRICNVAKDASLIEFNPAEKTKLRGLYRPDRKDIIWSADDIEAFKKSSSPHLWLPLYLGAYTGQREGDLLKLRFGTRVAGCPFYDGTHLFLRTGKTGSYVKVRAIEPLKTMLDAEIASVAGLPEDKRKLRDGYVLATLRNTPWTEDGFRVSFFKARNAANGEKGIKHADRSKTFHDLRGTAVTNLAKAGCSDRQIASITGHSMAFVGAILEAHYLGDRPALAEQAMDLLEASLQTAN